MKKRKAFTLTREEEARDAELRRLLALDPLDPDATLVYADWLEERGALPAATFLREQLALAITKLTSPKLLVRGRALFELGKQLDAAWIASISAPAIGGTAWRGRDDDGDLVWRFLPGGVLNYSMPGGTFENGTWEQVGITVAMETNAHYADYFGVIIGHVMRGNATNIRKRTWRWKVELDDAALPVPDEVHRVIHDDHVRRRAKPKPKKQPKQPALPLTRKTQLARKTPLRPKRPKSTKKG